MSDQKTKMSRAIRERNRLRKENKQLKRHIKELTATLHEQTHSREEIREILKKHYKYHPVKNHLIWWAGRREPIDLKELYEIQKQKTGWHMEDFREYEKMAAKTFKLTQTEARVKIMADQTHDYILLYEYYNPPEHTYFKYNETGNRLLVYPKTA